MQDDPSTSDADAHKRVPTTTNPSPIANRQPPQRFGEKLRILRRRRGMTQRELAAVFGYADHSHIALVENGKRNPTAELILKVADLFHTTTDQLLRDELELDDAG